MKKWYKSRTLWLNGMGLIAALLQYKYGMIMSGEIQGMILTILNIIIRFDTDDSISEKPIEYAKDKLWEMIHKK